MKHTVTLKYEHFVTFEIDAESPYDAYREAVSGLEYDSLTPTEEDVASLEIAKLAFDGREIEFSSHLDFTKKDERGLSCWKFVAHEDDDSFHRHELGSDHDLKKLIEHVSASPKPAAP